MWKAIVLLAVMVAVTLVVSRLLRKTPFEGRPFCCGCGDGLWKGRDKAIQALKENDAKKQ